MFKFKLENFGDLNAPFEFIKKLLIEPEEDLNVALSLCECVNDLFIITDGATDDMRICTISVQIDIGL